MTVLYLICLGSVSFELNEDEIVFHCQASAFPNVNNLKFCKISNRLIMFLICRILFFPGKRLMNPPWLKTLSF